MMKKILVAALCVATAACTTCCGRIDQAAQVETIEQVAYKEFTPEEQIVTGPQTATDTISKIFGKRVTPILENPYGAALWEYPSKLATGEEFTIYEVIDYESKEPGDKIIFLYEDDTKAAVSEVSDVTYVTGEDSEEVDIAWFDVASQGGDDTLAYWYNGVSYAFIPMTHGAVTSVWAVNAEKGEMRVIWRNNDCPIWHDNMFTHEEQIEALRAE